MVPPTSPTMALIIVMGVSGSGKSTVASHLSEALNCPFIDGDDLHPPANVAKMSRGQPLTDDDRYPWLVRIREVAVDRVKELACEEGGEGKSKKRRCLIVACSALKKSYRDVLRGIPPHATPHDLPQSEEAEASDGPALSTFFVFIDGSRSLLEERMNARQGHFMKTAMLDSQLKTLEPPNTTGEENVITVYLEDHIDDQVRMAEEKLKEAGAVAAE